MREKHKLNTPLEILHDDQVLTFAQFCVINGLSERTGRRILAGDDGPKIIQLSDRRIGVSMRANRAWQKSRES
jgi:hypothetical protein